MPRLRQVPRDEASASAQEMYTALFGDRDPITQPGTATGTPGNWWTVFANSADIFEHALSGFRLYRGDRKLDPKLRELGQTRAGYARGSQFVFSQHCKSMRALGCPEAQIEAIPHWQVSSAFDDRERALLAYADCMVLDGGRVPDALFATLKQHFSDEELLEFTYITCLYEMHATMTRALRLEYDDVDERVVEIAAPDPDAGDAMAVVDD